MSKYFNEMRKAEEWFAHEGLGKRQDVSTILENLRNPGAAVQEAEDEKLPPCNRVDIDPAATSPVVLSGNRAGHFAMEAYRALRTRLMRLQSVKGLRSIVLSSATPGDGKTVTTMNLGICCAQLREMPILLIDADLRSRRLSQFLGDPLAPGLAEVLKGESRFEDVILRTENPNLYVLAAGSPAGSPPELFTGKAWGELMKRCNDQFKMVLVDAPPVRPLADFELICAGCDAFVMVVRAHQTQREALQQVAGHIDSKKLIGVVLNGTDNHSKNSYYTQYGPQDQA